MAELPEKCCAKCIHAASGAVPGIANDALVCRLNPPSFPMQVNLPPTPANPGGRGLLYLQPVTQPGNYCSHFRDAGLIPFPLTP